MTEDREFGLCFRRISTITFPDWPRKRSRVSGDQQTSYRPLPSADRRPGQGRMLMAYSFPVEPFACDKRPSCSAKCGSRLQTFNGSSARESKFLSSRRCESMPDPEDPRCPRRRVISGFVPPIRLPIAPSGEVCPSPFAATTVPVRRLLKPGYRLGPCQRLMDEQPRPAQADTSNPTVATLRICPYHAGEHSFRRRQSGPRFRIAARPAANRNFADGGQHDEVGADADAAFLRPTCPALRREATFAKHYAVTCQFPRHTQLVGRLACLPSARRGRWLPGAGSGSLWSSRDCSSSWRSGFVHGWFRQFRHLALARSPLADFA